MTAKPRKILVTSALPYANGPIHLGRTELRCENPAYDTARTPQCNLQFVIASILFIY